MAIHPKAFRAATVQTRACMVHAQGRNLVIEYRFAERRPERLPDLAADLVRLKVDVIVTGTEALGSRPIELRCLARRDPGGGARDAVWPTAS